MTNTPTAAEMRALAAKFGITINRPNPAEVRRALVGSKEAGIQNTPSQHSQICGCGARAEEQATGHDWECAKCRKKRLATYRMKGHKAA